MSKRKDYRNCKKIQRAGIVKVYGKPTKVVIYDFEKFCPACNEADCAGKTVLEVQEEVLGIVNKVARRITK